jgi:hypothetical protein
MTIQSKVTRPWTMHNTALSSGNKQWEIEADQSTKKLLSKQNWTKDKELEIEHDVHSAPMRVAFESSPLVNRQI